MDMNVFEPEQGAGVPADLLQQEPHAEVGDSKSSVAPSDEERLAAGISMTRLQTKRLSGAQRKRLTRERKKEGTWMDKMPPRKTPSSQEKGAVGVQKDPTLPQAHLLRKNSNQKTQEHSSADWVIQGSCC
jgi:hypothetical protein